MNRNNKSRGFYISLRIALGTHSFEWHSLNQSCFNRKVRSSEKNTDDLCHTVGWGVKSNSNKQYIHARVQQHRERNRNKVVTYHS